MVVPRLLVFVKRGAGERDVVKERADGYVRRSLAPERDVGTNERGAEERAVGYDRRSLGP